jgi:hypothetical protein
MANITSAYGLKPCRNSGIITVNPYYVPASLASLGIGTPVVRGGTSNAVSTINGQVYPIGSLASVAVVTSGDGNKVTGSIVGFELIPTNLFVAGYNPASTERIAFVADHPEQKFTIIDDGANLLAVTDVGLNANLTVGTVNAFTGLDSTTLDTSTPASTATFQLKILGLNNRTGNELAVGAEWLVKINNHTDANIVAGV